MYHSIQIIPDSQSVYTVERQGGSVTGIHLNGKNTWDDWHLIPASRPLFNPPSQKTNYIDIPGTNGMLDASEILTNYPVFENRKGSNEFYVMNGYGAWHEKFSDIMDYKFTAGMEAKLDEIADKKVEWLKVLNDFYGPFMKEVEAVMKTAQRVTVSSGVKLSNMIRSGFSSSA